MPQSIGSALVQIMACRLFGAKPLSKSMLHYCQMDPSEQTTVKFSSKFQIFHLRKCIWIYRLWNGGHFVQGRWVNLLWPSEAAWWQRSGSTLAQVMACCLTAPSHYLNQCWLIISEVHIHIRAISQEMFQPSITKIRLQITYLKFHSNFPGANELN